MTWRRSPPHSRPAHRGPLGDSTALDDSFFGLVHTDGLPHGGLPERTAPQLPRADKEGVALRTGHHFAQPILRRFGLEQTVRPSLAFYNPHEEVDRFIAVVERLAVSRRR